LLSLPPNLGHSLLHVGQWESLLLRDLLVECLTRARELGLCLERHLLVDLALFVDLLSELGLLLCFLLFKREQTLVTVVGEMCLIQGCLKLRDLRLQISKLRGRIRRCDERSWLEVGTDLVEGTVIPDRQLTSDLQAIHRLFVGRRKFVRRAIALGSERVKELAYRCVETYLPMDGIQQIALTRAIVELDV